MCDRFLSKAHCRLAGSEESREIEKDIESQAGKAKPDWTRRFIHGAS
jgi:hypothetical protein